MTILQQKTPTAASDGRWMDITSELSPGRASELLDELERSNPVTEFRVKPMGAYLAPDFAVQLAARIMASSDGQAIPARYRAEVAELVARGAREGYTLGLWVGK